MMSIVDAIVLNAVETTVRGEYKKIVSLAFISPNKGFHLRKYKFYGVQIRAIRR